MSTYPFKNAALRADELRIHLGHLDYVAANQPERYAAEGMSGQRIEAERALRDWLLSVRRAIDEELAKLPELPERAAGYEAEGRRSGA